MRLFQSDTADETSITPTADDFLCRNYFHGLQVNGTCHHNMLMLRRFQWEWEHERCIDLTSGNTRQHASKVLHYISPHRSSLEVELEAALTEATYLASETAFLNLDNILSIICCASHDSHLKKLLHHSKQLCQP